MAGAGWNGGERGGNAAGLGSLAPGGGYRSEAERPRTAYFGRGSQLAALFAAEGLAVPATGVCYPRRLPRASAPAEARHTANRRAGAAGHSGARRSRPVICPWRNLAGMAQVLCSSRCSFLIAAVLLSCCVTAQPTRIIFISSVSALARSDAQEKRKFLLLPGEEGVAEMDLQFLEYAGYVRRLLGETGFVPASSVDDADAIVFLSYGIGDPKEHVYSYSVPVWGQTGVSSSYTTGTVSTNGSYSGSTTYVPTYGVTGHSSHVGTYTTYTRFMRVAAFDAREYVKSQKLIQVWTTTVVSTGSSGDLRRVFPYMAAACRRLVSVSTPESVKISVPEGDPYVEWLLAKPRATPTVR